MLKSQVMHTHPETTKQDKWLWLGYTTVTATQSILPVWLQMGQVRAASVKQPVVDKTHLGAGSSKRITKSLVHTNCTLIPHEAVSLSSMWKCLCINSVYSAQVRWEGYRPRVFLSCFSPQGVNLQVLCVFPSIPSRQMHAAFTSQDYLRVFDSFLSDRGTSLVLFVSMRQKYQQYYRTHNILVMLLNFSCYIQPIYHV